LPAQAEPLQRAQLLVALSVGTEIIDLRRIAPQLGILPELDSALDALARGQSAATIARLAGLDRRLASRSAVDPQTCLALRERGRILAVCDALVEHRAYFDTGAPA
jgi:hypothetical protein